MRIVRNNYNIILAFGLVFVFRVSLANEHVEKKIITQNQEKGKKKSHLVITSGKTADIQEGIEQESRSIGEDTPKTNDIESGIRSTDHRTIDTPKSVRRNPISKYNFIFYLLYKFEFEP